MRKVRTYYGEPCWIVKYKGIYIPCNDFKRALLRVASPSFMAMFNQEELKRAYETGSLNHDI